MQFIVFRYQGSRRAYVESVTCPEVSNFVLHIGPVLGLVAFAFGKRPNVTR